MIDPSELILNPDGSIYHLKLHPEQIARKIIVAGDPGRIESISSHFDRIDYVVKNREFVTHTGIYKGQKISAVATGIGTDNIDIVLNELDALLNIDLEKREIKKNLSRAEIVRIGTCGSIQEDIPADEIIASTYALGLDGLMHYYDFEMDKHEKLIHSQILKQCNWNNSFTNPYLVKGNDQLIEKIAPDFHRGITLTAPGFYAPQGRKLRLKPREEDFNKKLRAFNFEKLRMVNYEMETSALYGLSRLLGHDACTVCAVVANRYANSFSKDYKPVINGLIEKVLNRLLKD